jgi:hypothetical protein
MHGLASQEGVHSIKGSAYIRLIQRTVDHQPLLRLLKYKTLVSISRKGVSGEKTGELTCIIGPVMRLSELIFEMTNLVKHVTWSSADTDTSIGN